MWALKVVNLEMRSQRRAFIILPQTWKQTAPDVDPTSFRPPVTLPPWSLLHGLLEFLLAFLCLFPCPAQATWFQVGVVGPWGCDPLFAKALPSVAAQLAVNRINRDASLSYAVTFDYAVLQVRYWSMLHLPENDVTSTTWWSRSVWKMGANIRNCHSLYLLAKVNKLAEVANVIPQGSEAERGKTSIWIICRWNKDYYIIIFL